VKHFAGFGIRNGPALLTHRDGRRFILRTDEMLTAFVELERATHELAVDLIS